MDRERYVLVLDVPNDGRPGVVRVRRLLKTLLRAHRMKCVRVEREEAVEPAAAREERRAA